VLDDTSFVLEPAKIYGLIGENGVGKTTLISILANLLKPDSGRVENLENPGLLLQGVRFYDNLTVIENLQLFVVERKLKTIEPKEMLALTGFPKSHYDKKYKNLSQGYKQRLAIVQGFLTDGDLVLLDEPFSTVDLPTIRVLKKAIKLFVAKTGKTVLISSHQLKEVSDLLDETLLIRDRKVINLTSKANYTDGTSVFYLTCMHSDELQKLTGFDQFSINRQIDDVFEIELNANTKISQILNMLEENGIDWARVEKNPPLEFLFYQREQQYRK
jgi:ABC-type multidrug transport system ATPase subunit